MSYKIKTHSGDTYYPWFKNSWKSLSSVGLLEQTAVDYEKHFKVKLDIERDQFLSINQVEFPSEEDALLFLLRWA